MVPWAQLHAWLPCIAGGKALVQVFETILKPSLRGNSNLSGQGLVAFHPRNLFARLRELADLKCLVPKWMVAKPWVLSFGIPGKGPDVPLSPLPQWLQSQHGILGVLRRDWWPVVDICAHRRAEQFLYEATSVVRVCWCAERYTEEGGGSQPP